MKKIFPLMVLITLVSCDDSIRSRSTLSNNESTIQKYSVSANAERGSVTNIRKQGSEFAVDFTKTSGLLTTYPINTKTTAVVIHIDGNKVYRHLTIVDLTTKEKTTKVVMEIENIQQEIKEILDSGKGRIIGDNLVLRYSEEMPASEDTETEIVRKYAFNATVNLWKPHCDIKHQTDAAGTMIINGNIDSKSSYKTFETSTCEKSYSMKQVSEIDLSSIEFCSYPNGEDQQCEQNQDMSYLTSDLL